MWLSPLQYDSYAHVTEVTHNVRLEALAVVESSWNVIAHGDAREGKWRGNWRMEWVASTLHTTSEHGLSSITTADAHTSAASGRLNWRPRRFKWTRPFPRKTKPGFCACAITFQTQSNYEGNCQLGCDVTICYKTSSLQPQNTVLPQLHSYKYGIFIN